MRVLVVGSGGREHALVWSIAASPLATEIYCAPGNAGIAEDAICVPIQATDVDGLVSFAQKERIDLVVIGPEAAFAAGLADALEAEGREVAVTREPGGTPIAERIREVLLDPENDGMTPMAELMLYEAARAQHVGELMLRDFLLLVPVHEVFLDHADLCGVQLNLVVIAQTIG